MRDGVRIEAHPGDFAASVAVVVFVDGVVEDELGAAFGTVLGGGDDHGGAEDDFSVSGFEEEEGAVFNAEEFADLRGDDDGASGVNVDCGGGDHEMLLGWGEMRRGDCGLYADRRIGVSEFQIF